MRNVLPSNVSREWEPKDLKYLPYESKRRALKEIEYAAIRQGPLRPWMKKLAEWAVTQNERLSAKQLGQMATQLAKVKIATHMARVLMYRDDWIAYKEEVASDVVGQARRQLEQRSVEYLETHYEAMKAARVNVATDPGTAAKITEPVMDRVWPKKEEGNPAPTTIVVNLAPHQKVEEVVDYEILPCEIVEQP